MRNTIILAGLVAIIATPGFAQSSGHSAVMLADHTMRAGKLIGMAVYNDQGEKIGTVDDILVTAGAIEPIAVVSVGGFLGVGERLTSEPLSHLKLAPGDKMMMPGATKPILMAKPSFKYQYGLQGGGG